MDKTILTLLKKSNNLNNILTELENILELYEDLKNLYDRNILYDKLKKWLKIKYKIHNTKTTSINNEKETATVIFHDGKEFSKDMSLTLTYEIELHPYLKIEFTILADNETHFAFLMNRKKYIDILFYKIEPLIKNAFIHYELQQASYIDSTTGLYNRRFLLDHLNKMLPLAMRENKQIAFLAVGVDHFKAVIDEFDYTIGDKVLIELSKSISKNIRQSDIAVRLEGDEFLVVLANIAHSESAVIVAKKLIESFSKCEVDVNSYTGQTLKKTICVGISIYPNDSTSVDQILKYADISLYEAKNKGRSQALRFQKKQISSIELF